MRSLAILSLGLVAGVRSAPVRREASPSNQSQFAAQRPGASNRQKLEEVLARRSGQFTGFTDASIIATALRKDSRKRIARRPDSSHPTLTSSDPTAGISADTGLKELARDMNAQADPCENFYAYACGSWMQKTERPEDVLSVSRGFSSLAERVDSTLFEIFHDADTPKVADFFKECTNNVQRNEQQTVPLQPWLQLIDDATTIESIFFVLGRMHAFNMNPLFDIYTDVDEEDPDTYFSMLYPAGWGLDDPNLLLDPPDGVKEAYVTRVATLLELGGESGADSGVPAKEQANAVWNFEYYLLLYTLLNTEAEGEQQGEQASGNQNQEQGQGRGQGQGPGGASSPAGGVAGGVGSVARGAMGAGGGDGDQKDGDENQNRGEGASLNSFTAQARRSALEKLPPVPRSIKDFALLDVPKTAHPNAMARNVMHALRSRALHGAGNSACTKDSFEPCALWGVKLARNGGNGGNGGNTSDGGNGGNTSDVSVVLV